MNLAALVVALSLFAGPSFAQSPDEPDEHFDDTSFAEWNRMHEEAFSKMRRAFSAHKYESLANLILRLTGGERERGLHEAIDLSEELEHDDKVVYWSRMYLKEYPNGRFIRDVLNTYARAPRDSASPSSEIISAYNDAVNRSDTAGRLRFLMDAGNSLRQLGELGEARKYYLRAQQWLDTDAGEWRRKNAWQIDRMLNRPAAFSTGSRASHIEQNLPPYSGSPDDLRRMILDTRCDTIILQYSPSGVPGEFIRETFEQLPPSDTSSRSWFLMMCGFGRPADTAGAGSLLSRLRKIHAMNLPKRSFDHAPDSRVFVWAENLPAQFDTDLIGVMKSEAETPLLDAVGDFLAGLVSRRPLGENDPLFVPFVQNVYEGNIDGEMLSGMLKKFPGNAVLYRRMLALHDPRAKRHLIEALINASPGRIFSDTLVQAHFYEYCLHQWNSHGWKIPLFRVNEEYFATPADARRVRSCLASADPVSRAAGLLHILIFNRSAAGIEPLVLDLIRNERHIPVFRLALMAGHPSYEVYMILADRYAASSVGIREIIQNYLKNVRGGGRDRIPPLETTMNFPYRARLFAIESQITERREKQDAKATLAYMDALIAQEDTVYRADLRYRKAEILNNDLHRPKDALKIIDGLKGQSFWRADFAMRLKVDILLRLGRPKEAEKNVLQAREFELEHYVHLHEWHLLDILRRGSARDMVIYARQFKKYFMGDRDASLKIIDGYLNSNRGALRDYFRYYRAMTILEIPARRADAVRELSDFFRENKYFPMRMYVPNEAFWVHVNHP